MANTTRDVRRDRAPARDPGGIVVSLKFRDQLRTEFDENIREICLKISRNFKRLPSRIWNGVRREPLLADRPWGRMLTMIDEAVREDTPLEELLELTAAFEAYIRIRFEQHQLPTVAAQIDAERHAPVPLRKAA